VITSFSRSGRFVIASATISRSSVCANAVCGSGPCSSSIVSMSATWSPPDPEIVHSSSSAAIEEREMSVRLPSSSSTLMPTFAASSSSLGARPSFASSSPIARSICRARERTDRGTQSSARSSSRMEPLMRAMA
jgi:hypothetical protein